MNGSDRGATRLHEDEGLFSHVDLLADLDAAGSPQRRIEILHARIRREFPFVHRLAVVSHEPKTSMLRTFLASGEEALVRYETPLESAPSLKEILRTGRPRVVNDLSLFDEGTHDHTRAIRSRGFLSSYTREIRLGGDFWGFLFFNSYEIGRFTPDVLDALDVYGHLVAGMVTSEILAVRTLAAAVRTAHAMVHLRDPETGGHLERMAEFARLIARELAAEGRRSFDDAYIEQLYLFAPLHDLGKIGIPDRILLKAGSLSPDEREVMKDHSRKGAEMIDRIIANFGLEHFTRVDILRNIALYHHEAMDGTGYPSGLRGEEIPIEARMVAVADVFDALTSARSYKSSWSNEEAFRILRAIAQSQLDTDCVEALIRARARVEEVQARFGRD
jgi:HD-GYP domain-containing protein (c-di-GMP phosphodiesterase class II)